MKQHSHRINFTRRNFLKISSAKFGILSTGGLAGVAPNEAADNWPGLPQNLLRKGDVVLFQGDSITDTGRSREEAMVPNQQSALGSGYAWLAAAELLVDRPNDSLKVYNRGISGHEVVDLARRWQADCLELKPSLLSILIGVNDFAHTLDGGSQRIVEDYERNYLELLARTRQAVPRVKLVVCEPFVLRCGAVNGRWFPGFDGYRAAAKRVAKAARATFIPFQSMFDVALQFAPAEHWAKDGVHPSNAGAALMAHTWLRAVAGKR